MSGSLLTPFAAMNSPWKTSFAVVAAAAMALAPVAVGQISAQAKATNVTVARGTFTDSAKYTGSGTATAVRRGTARTLRLAKNFEAVGGIKLRMYLATDAGGATHIDLGAMQAAGAQSFRIPKTVNLTTYRYAVAWCVSANAPITQAKLVPTGRS
jgi:tRNA U34 5-carboxymethylaminomethyl modifying enzyme MnmG/GidA